MPNREMVTIELRPAVGSRFQPTGFPDLGAGLFKRPVDGGWQDCLLVESAQSMANHLEATGWDQGAAVPVPAFASLPYVRVLGTDGRFLASSRTEAHRLASAYVRTATLHGVPMGEEIRERLHLVQDKPMAPCSIAKAIFQLDPMCLVHGVYFVDKGAKLWPGQPKVARALTSFVEAHDVLPAVSGGVKRDDVHHSVEGTPGTKEGYSFVPFHRTEYVARHIEAAFCLDLDQLASYGLPPAAADLLAVAARFEVRSLLDRGFRPRTACDLVPVDPGAVDSALPPLAELTADLHRLSAACAHLWDSPSVLEVVWATTAGRKKEA